MVGWLVWKKKEEGVKVEEAFSLSSVDAATSMGILPMKSHFSKITLRKVHDETLNMNTRIMGLCACIIKLLGDYTVFKEKK